MMSKHRFSFTASGRSRPAGGRPQRVCLLIGQLGLGGAEKQAALLARGLAERGVETSVLVMFAGGPHEDALRTAGVPVVHLGFPRLCGDGLPPRDGTAANKAVRVLCLARRAPLAMVRSTAAFTRLVIRLRGERPDVLHTYLFQCCVAGGLAAPLAGVPAVVAGRRALGECRRDRPALFALARLATRCADLLIANAQAVSDDVRRVERVPPAKIVTVYNGIEDSAFETVPPARVDAEAAVILCVANLIWYKGHRHLLEAVALLRDRGTRCTLVLVGDGPEREPLERLSGALGLDVRFLGHRTDVAALLARADLYVHPSLTEGMSNAVMEAMAAGKPVVATDVGGTGELLRGRGVLVPPRDATALADALAGLLASPALAARLGAEARSWSLANLRAETMVERHLDLYGRLVAAACAE